MNMYLGLNLLMTIPAGIDIITLAKAQMEISKPAEVAVKLDLHKYWNRKRETTATCEATASIKPNTHENSTTHLLNETRNNS